MGLYLVIGTRNLRKRVAAACTCFYMPLGCCAVVQFSGSAEALAQRLMLGAGKGPPRARSGVISASSAALALHAQRWV